jgi:hypothetical protein
MAKREGKTKAETTRQQEAFLAWYELDRHFDETLTKTGLIRQTLANWINKFDWHKRADALDAKAFAKLEEKLAREKANRTAEMIENHFKYGNSLIAVGGNYLTKNGVDNGAQAVAAIKNGVEIQRTAEGLATGRTELSGKNGEPIKTENKTVFVLDFSGKDDSTGESSKS